MLDRIEKMRKKSYGERRRITFLVSVSLTVVIAFVWGTAILPQTLTLDEKEPSRAATASPFKTLSEDVGVVFDDIQIGINELGKEFNQLWNKGKVEPEEEIVSPSSPRDESSSVDIMNEYTPSNTYDMDAREIENAIEEDGYEDVEIRDETEGELEIEG